MNKNIEKIYSPTPMQINLIQSTLFENNQELYIEQLKLSIQGKFSIARFKQTWKTLNMRHELLRSAFAWNNLTAIKLVILETVKVPLNIIDITHLTIDEQHNTIKNEVDRIAKLGFQLNKAPLYNIHLFILDSENFEVILTFHHAIIDGWSLGVLYSEMVQIYQSNNELNTTLELKHADSFQRYANWINNYSFTQERKFWQERMSKITTNSLLPLSLKCKKNKLSNSKHETITLQLSKEQATALNLFCQSAQITEFNLISTAWVLTLALFLDQTQITFGSVLAVRNNTEIDLKSIIGPIINTIPISININADQTIDELINYIKNESWQCLSNGQLPLTNILSCDSNSDSNFHLFDTIIAMENFISRSNAQVSDDSAIVIKNLAIYERIKYPLVLTCNTQMNWEIKFLYHADILEDRYMQSVVDNFHKILLAICTQQKNTIHDFLNQNSLNNEPIQGEKVQSLDTIHDYLSMHVKIFPNTIALQDDRQKIDYATLDSIVSKVASNLEISGSDIVGILLNRSVEAFISILAILKKGACFLALDPNYPDDRLIYMIENSNITAIISNTTLMDRDINKQKNIRYYDINRLQESTLHQCDEMGIVQEQNTAYLVYTSGSTGLPKASKNSYLGVKNLLASCLKLIDRDNEKFLQFASLSFDASFLELCLALVKGGTLYIAGNEIRTNPKLLTEFMQKQKITTLFLTPSVLSILDSEQLPFLHTLFIGGEYCPEKLILQWQKNRKFYILYGPSEAAGITLYNPTFLTNNYFSLGYPLVNTSAKIINQLGVIVPHGGMGELWLGGHSIGTGYLNNDSLTKNKFVNNGYLTGDTAYVGCDRQIYYVGRKDNQIKIRGNRVELEEIEKILINLLSIEEAIVLLDTKESNNSRIVAFLQAQGVIDHADLKQKLRKKLPAFMIPNDFIMIKNWPLTPNLKIDRKQLKNLMRRSQCEDLPINTQEETIIIKMISEVLNIPQNSIHNRDNFFSLGGNSLNATSLLLSLRKNFKKDFSLQIIYESEDIADLTNKVYSDTLHNLTLEKVSSSSLLNDSRIDLDFTSIINNIAGNVPAQKILLTGVTGFFGIYLLQELLMQTDAIIYCLVRNRTKNACYQDIYSKLEKINFDIPENLSARIQIVCGNLVHSQLGLEQSVYEFLTHEVDIIYHCAANVNLVESYSAMRQDNLLTQRNIIDFATCHKNKPIEYISTISVLMGLNSPNIKIYENQIIPESSLLNNGYMQTKWVGEQLFIYLRENSDVPVNIYRLPRIWGDFQSGYSNLNDALIILLSACINIQQVPDIWLDHSYKLDIAPADYLAKIILGARQLKEFSNLNYHVLYPHSISIYSIIQMIQKKGYLLKIADYQTWQNQILEQSKSNEAHSCLKKAASMLSSFGQTAISNNSQLDTKNTSDIMKTLNITVPPFSSEIFEKYLQFLVIQEYIPKV